MTPSPARGRRNLWRRPLTWDFGLSAESPDHRIEHGFERGRGVVGELASALDALATDDLSAMAAPTVLERTAELVRARNRIDAELVRTVRRAELVQAAEHDGLTSMASWLRGHCRLSPTASSQLVRNGRALEQLGATAASFADGLITAEQVAVIAPVARPEHLAAAAEHDVDLGEVDVVLAEAAATRQHVQLGRIVHHYLSLLDPDGVEPDPTEGRSLSLAKHSDGSLSGRFELDSVGGEKVQAGGVPRGGVGPGH